MPRKKIYTMKKWEGDDVYSWAVFLKSRPNNPIVVGCSHAEARYHRDLLEKANDEKLMKPPAESIK